MMLERKNSIVTIFHDTYEDSKCFYLISSHMLEMFLSFSGLQRLFSQQHSQKHNLYVLRKRYFNNMDYIKNHQAQEIIVHDFIIYGRVIHLMVFCRILRLFSNIRIPQTLANMKSNIINVTVHWIITKLILAYLTLELKSGDVSFFCNQSF